MRQSTLPLLGGIRLNAMQVVLATRLQGLVPTCPMRTTRRQRPRNGGSELRQDQTMALPTRLVLVPTPARTSSEGVLAIPCALDTILMLRAPTIPLQALEVMVVTTRSSDEVECPRPLGWSALNALRFYCVRNSTECKHGSSRDSVKVLSASVCGWSSG